MTAVVNDVDRLDLATLTEVVSSSLAEPVSILDRQPDEPLLGAGSGTRLVRIRGTAATESGRTRPWSVVLKFFTPEHYDFQSRSDEPGAFDYWRREWCLYRSTWQRDLPGPLTTPRLDGAGEYEEDDGKPAGWVALEDLGVLERRWPTDRFRVLARHAGRFNGWSLTTNQRPDDPWLATDWLRQTTEHAESMVLQLDQVRADELFGQIVTAGLATDIRRLWDMRETAYAALAKLPQPLCHNDLFTRNVLIDEDADRTVALDWAFCGAGAVGQELSALVGSTAVFLDSDPGDWPLIEEEALAAYAIGLREAGGGCTDSEVATGYLISLSLRFGISTLPSLAGMTLYPEYHDQVAAVLGCRYDDFVVNSTAFMDFAHERVRKVLTLLDA